MMKTRDEHLPTALAIFASVAGILVMLVLVVLTDKVFDGAQWVYFIAGVAEAAVMVGIIRLVLGRVPLRPWARRMWGREK
jgi:hypothetical protein